MGPIDRLEQAAISRAVKEPHEREIFWRKLDPEQSVTMERSHLWVRLAIFVLPLALLAIFREAAITAAIVCAVAVFGSYAIIWGLLRYWPDAVRNGQIQLRLLDVLLLLIGTSQVQAVLLRQTGTVTDVFDTLYVLTVISCVANAGLRGGFVIAGAGSLAIIADRLLLIRWGLLQVSDRTPGQIALTVVTYTFLFAVTSSTVFYLMQVSGMLAARRERELSAIIASDNVKLEASNEELERANEVLKARRRMTADIAHDLRNPLTAISGYAQAISEGLMEPTAERFNAIQHQTERLDRLVGDLRLLSLADIGALTLNMGTVDPDDLLQRTVENFALAAEQREIQLTSSIDGVPHDIPGDLSRLEQVLANLVSNALRHTPVGGRVQLTGRLEDGQLLLGIEDSGEGIAETELPLVFDRLYRAGPQAQRDAAGSGLGLAICKALVTAHGGDIGVSSTLGEGTVFTIRLPAPVPAVVPVPV